jgi:hypothetical protein
VAETVHVALLLKPQWRSPGGIARVRVIAATLGIEVTAAGEVAVSGSTSSELCEFLFGRTGGHAVPNVPEPLRELVESVSIIPTTRRL